MLFVVGNAAAMDNGRARSAAVFCSADTAVEQCTCRNFRPAESGLYILTDGGHIVRMRQSSSTISRSSSVSAMRPRTRVFSSNNAICRGTRERTTDSWSLQSRGLSAGSSIVGDA